MDFDSPLTQEEAKWSSTPNYRPLSACSLRMRLCLEQFAEVSCFLSGTFVRSAEVAVGDGMGSQGGLTVGILGSVVRI